ncbi:MAG: prolipoprotein diacylglyceryl transferase, partial [Ruminococcaceae bacterium]|nr:prolipoprotein diacylglyceryl transferase [Oscillospiraceae bacterium]
MTKVYFPKLGLEFSINRVAFKIPGLDLEVYWYGLLIAIGAVLAFVYVYKRANEFGVDKDQLSDLVIAGIISGVLGARIYYVVFSSPGEISGFAEIFNLRQGGLAFYGAVIGGVLSTFFYCKIKKVRFLPVLDLTSFGFLIGQGIGRWGNFVNQEAFGVNTDLPWGMTSSVIVNYLNSNFAELRELGMIVDPMKPVHPTFLYESVWCFIGFIFLHFMAKHRRF